MRSRDCYDKTAVETVATGGSDRRGFGLGPYGTGNETRQVLTWGDAPYPSAVQSELLIPRKSPLFGNPGPTFDSRHVIKPLDALIKLLACGFI